MWACPAEALGQYRLQRTLCHLNKGLEHGGPRSQEQSPRILRTPRLQPALGVSHTVLTLVCCPCLLVFNMNARCKLKPSCEERILSLPPSRLPSPLGTALSDLCVCPESLYAGTTKCKYLFPFPFLMQMVHDVLCSTRVFHLLLII